MAKPEAPKTYEELRQLRQEEWEAKQAIARAQMADLHAQIAAMPDVANAPSKDIDWSHPDLSCARCAGKYFRVKSWVTVNGLRHRVWVKCSGCGHTDTWDWATSAWMGG